MSVTVDYELVEDNASTAKPVDFSAALERERRQAKESATPPLERGA